MAAMIEADALELFGLQESPEISEQMIVNEQRRAGYDSLTARLLESVYWEADRDVAFDRYRQSLDFAKTLSLLDTFKIPKDKPLVEIGGGSGFLSWGLSQSGFKEVSLLEPNPHYTTGTGYLRSRQDTGAITVENSLSKWYASSKKYQTVVTRNCVHHFPNLALVAASIRQKVEPHGYWVMIREPYVQDSSDLYRFMHTHPFSQRYQIYEFAFPPTHYVQALELAGFKLQAVVPAGYANNALSMYSEAAASPRIERFTRAVDWLLARMPSTTVALYRAESSMRRLRRWLQCFSQPQVMLFQRQELAGLPESAIWYPYEAPRADQESSQLAAKCA